MVVLVREVVVKKSRTCGLMFEKEALRWGFLRVYIGKPLLVDESLILYVYCRHSPMLAALTAVLQHNLGLPVWFRHASLGVLGKGLSRRHHIPLDRISLFYTYCAPWLC